MGLAIAIDVKSMFCPLQQSLQDPAFFQRCSKTIFMNAHFYLPFVVKSNSRAEKLIQGAPRGSTAQVLNWQLNNKIGFVRWFQSSVDTDADANDAIISQHFTRTSPLNANGGCKRAVSTGF